MEFGFHGQMILHWIIQISTLACFESFKTIFDGLRFDYRFVRFQIESEMIFVRRKIVQSFSNNT